MYRKAKVISGTFAGEEVLIEGTDKEVFGKSWGYMNGNIACLNFAMRSIKDGINTYVGNCYYGKHENGLGDVFHESELQFMEESK